MKPYAFVLLLSLLLVGNSACQRQDGEIIERHIIAKVQQDTPFLAQLEATYSLAFTNYRPNVITSDDFYVRKDLASVFYGYALKDAEIHVVNESNENILSVKLPHPKQISIDRKILSIENAHDDYLPLDEEKDPINVDAWMNEHLQEAIQQYEEKTVEMTKTMSQQYFEAMAHRFGLKLKLEFVE